MASNLVCKIHPVVLFSIIDSYERRNEDAKRVIGTLLGAYEKGVVEVTNCFAVPHNESEDEVAVDIDYARSMYELHKKVNANEVIVGWSIPAHLGVSALKVARATENLTLLLKIGAYATENENSRYSTGSEVSVHSVLIHEYYSREAKNPIHFTVDTIMRGGKMNMKAYVTTAIGVPGKTTGTMFTPVSVDITSYDSEQTGVEVLQQGKYKAKRAVSIQTDLAKVESACSKLRQMLQQVIEYVDSILAGKTPADTTVGRFLLDMVSSVPKVDPDEFENMLNSNMKDLLMVVYLANLTRTQLLLNEKINSIVS